jgi:hypothetical protein
VLRKKQRIETGVATEAGKRRRGAKKPKEKGKAPIFIFLYIFDG